MLALKTFEANGVNSVDVRGEWEILKMPVDSSATETVMREEVLECAEMKMGAAARRGVEYVVANGVTNRILEKRHFHSRLKKGSSGELRHKYATPTRVC